MRTNVFVATTALMLALASPAYAGLVISGPLGDPTTGSFEKITPAAEAGNLGTYELSDERGSIDFWYGNDRNNELVRLDPQDADGSAWGHADLWDESLPIFTTGLPSQSGQIWIDLSGVEAYGFSFQIGANFAAHAFFDVFYTEDNVSKSMRESGIRIGPGVSPGFQVANVGGSCQRIDKILVDPYQPVWGVFNMGIDTTGGSCVSVPEPGSVGLLALGLVGLGLLRTKKNKNESARQSATS